MREVDLLRVTPHSLPHSLPHSSSHSSPFLTTEVVRLRAQLAALQAQLALHTAQGNTPVQGNAAGLQNLSVSSSQPLNVGTVPDVAAIFASQTVTLAQGPAPMQQVPAVNGGLLTPSHSVCILGNFGQLLGNWEGQIWQRLYIQFHDSSMERVLRGA